MKERVALVVMPFASAGFPVLGVSLLQAGLERQGIACDLHYLNLYYAQLLGLDRYHWLAESPHMSMMGEWVFAREVFSDRLPSDADYRRDILFPRSGDNLNLRHLLDLFNARNNAGQFLDECLAAVDWSQYGVVGFSSTFEQNLPSLALASRLRQKFPDLTIAMGGNNCEGEMGIALHRNFPFLDYVCSGVGDLALPELVKRIFAGKSGQGIDGIIARVDGETMLPERMANPVSNLDALPIPSYDDYYSQLRAYGFRDKLVPLTPFESARGCWWGAKMHCTFCGLNGGSMAFMSKSAGRVLTELEILGEKYGTNFVAVDNILDLKYLNTVFPQIIERGLDYSFHYETKVNLKRNQLETLRNAGVKNLQPGIESLSTPILKLMKKGCTALQNIEFLKWCNELGIRVSWNLLYGFPGEDSAEYSKILRLMPSLHHLQAPDYCARVRPDRFSPYFTRPHEFGLQGVNPDRSYNYVYPLAPEAVRQIAYFFEFDQSVTDALTPYAEALVQAAQEWQQRPVACQLIVTSSDAGVLIEDDRAPGAPQRFVLPEVEGHLYLFCDEARSFTAIADYVATLPAGRDVTQQALQKMLDWFLERRLMAAEGVSYLSLATRRTMEPEMWAAKNAMLRTGSPWLNWKERAVDSVTVAAEAE